MCPSPESDELTEDELTLLQEILEAHRATYSQDELAPLSPLSFNSIKLVGLSEACKEPKEKEKKSEPKFPNKVIAYSGNFTLNVKSCSFSSVVHTLEIE